MNAAANLRIPYWDWAADLAVPQATVPRTVKVKVPNGDGLRENEMENPLATYRYPSAALEGRFGIFDEVRGRTQIIRCPAPGRYPESANNALRSRAYPEWVVSTSQCCPCKRNRRICRLTHKVVRRLHDPKHFQWLRHG